MILTFNKLNKNKIFDILNNENINIKIGTVRGGLYRLVLNNKLTLETAEKIIALGAKVER